MISSFSPSVSFQLPQLIGVDESQYKANLDRRRRVVRETVQAMPMAERARYDTASGFSQSQRQRRAREAALASLLG